MSTIIAGHFQLQDEVARARRALVDAGFAGDRISGFYLSQPGQHDLTPIGGDSQHSPGAKESPEGLAQGAGTGAAVGIVAGAATSPVTGPLGPVVGGLLGAHHIERAKGDIVDGAWADFDPATVPDIIH